MAKRPVPPTATDEEVRVLIERYRCPVPFHEVRTRFLGNIASPIMGTSPMKEVESLWGGELPEFETIDAANELIGASRMKMRREHRVPLSRQAISILRDLRAHQEWAFFAARGTKTRDLERCTIDPVMFGKTAMAVVPRLAANSIVVAKATPRKIEAATATLRSMSEGRNHEILMTGLNLSRLGLSPNEIEAELFAVVGREPHMRKKIPGVIKSLGRYGRR